MTARLAPWRNELLLLGLILVAAVWASLSSPFYLNAGQITYSLQQSIAIVGLLALGLMPVMVIGEIDISLPAIMALGNIAFARLSQGGVGLVPALLVVLAMTTAAGLVNGWLVVAFRLPSLAVTLGAMGAYRALALLLGGQEGYADFPDSYLGLGSGSIGPLPASLLLLLAAFVLFGFVLHATVFGRLLYTVGSNSTAARMSGIPVGRVKISAFALAGLTAGLAALVYIGQYQSARADNASDMLLFIVTAVVLGGVDIFGGSGNVVGLLLSLLLLGTLKNGMGLANLSGPVQTLVIGLVLIFAVLAAQFRTWRGSLPGWLGGG